MGANSAIEWTDHTFNAWYGCTKVSSACDFCYAEIWAKRSGLVQWGGPRRRSSVQNWREPLKWNRDAAAAKTVARVFCNSLGDWADAEVPDEWRADLFALIEATPNLEWLLLTKRHALARRYLPKEPRKNIRVGMTVENEDMARLRLPRLAQLGLEGWRTFVSYEPALGPIKWWPWLDTEGISGGTLHWIIAGGESGAHARAPHPDWFRDCRDACAKAGVPFFLKQWGEWMPHQVVAGGDLGADVRAGRVEIVHPTGQSNDEVFRATGRNTIHGSRYMVRVGKKRAGAMLDGREHREFPTVAA